MTYKNTVYTRIALKHDTDGKSRLMGQLGMNWQVRKNDSADGTA